MGVVFVREVYWGRRWLWSVWVSGIKAGLSCCLKKVVVILRGKNSEHDEMPGSKGITVRVWLQLAFIHVLCAYDCFNATPFLSTAYPPTADDNSESINDVPYDKYC